MSEQAPKTHNVLTGHGSDVSCIILIVTATEAYVVYSAVVAAQTTAKRKYVLARRG